MTIPIGSIPRPLALIEAGAVGDGADPALDGLHKAVIRDAVSTARAPAFAKIHARVQGTMLASKILESF